MQVHERVKTFFQHVVLFIVFTLIGSEIGVLILTQEFGGVKLGFIGLAIAWPSIVISALYVSLFSVRNNHDIT